MIKKLLFACFLSMSMCFLFFQEVNAAFYSYSDKTHEENIFVICTARPAHPDNPNGGYILAGWSPSFRPYLIRIDNYGNKLWQKEYPSGMKSKWVDYSDNNSFVTVTASGHIIKVLDSEDGEIADGFVDVQGNYLVQLPNAGESIIKKCNSGYIFLTPDSRRTIIKTADNFTVEWQYQLGFGARLTSIVQTNDEGYIISGKADDGNSLGVLLLKLDKNGQLDKTTFSPNGYVIYPEYALNEWEDRWWIDIGFSIDQTEDEGYVVSVLDKDEYVVLLKTNRNGQKEWDNRFGIKSKYDIGYTYGIHGGIKVLDNGNILLGGHTEDFVEDKVIHKHYILETDKNGFEIEREILNSPQIPDGINNRLN